MKIEELEKRYNVKIRIIVESTYIPKLLIEFSDRKSIQRIKVSIPEIIRYNNIIRKKKLERILK